MSQNKVTSYLLYGLGEIVLVVVGILIAIQLEGLRDNYKQTQKVELILADLKKDLLADIEILETYHEERISDLRAYDSLKSTLHTDTIEFEDLVDLSKNRFPYPAREFPPMNDQTYRMILNSGEVQNIPDSLYRSLKAYYDLHGRLRSDLGTFLGLYLRQISYHIGEYPINDEYANFLYGSPLSEELWSLSSRKDFLKSFNTLASNRRVYIVDSERYSILLAEEAEKIVEKFFSN